MVDRAFKAGTYIYCSRGEFRQLRKELTDRGYVITSRRTRGGTYWIYIIEAPERMSAAEDKEKIVEMLLPVLQQTRAGCDITELRYEKTMMPNMEQVVCKMEHGRETTAMYIDVTADSGTAMIRDIIKRIE